MKQIVIFVIVLIAVVAVLNYFREGFDNPNTKIIPPCPPGYKHCRSGDCRLASDVLNPCL